VEGWTDAAFLDEARTWIETHVRVRGPIEQTHVQVWSTVLRVPTDDGMVWFKAPDDASEARLTSVLGSVRPDLVPEVVASDLERGWMLLRDAGTRLREILDRDPDLRHWETVLARCAELQLAVMPRVDELLALGVPDFRLEGLTARVAALLDAEEFLMLGEPDGLTVDQREALRADLPRIGSMVDGLAGFGIGPSIQHDDLNDGNVFVREGAYRIMDWGDACVSHPFHTLTVALRATAFRLHLDPGGPEILRLRDAYLEPFSAFGGRDELVHVADIAYRTGTLARALAWQSYVAVRAPEDRLPDMESVPYGLRLFLEGGPLGSWD
jgi:hypothetical protein